MQQFRPGVGVATRRELVAAVAEVVFFTTLPKRTSLLRFTHAGKNDFTTLKQGKQNLMSNSKPMFLQSPAFVAKRSI
jgi:hypothetical protein